MKDTVKKYIRTAIVFLIVTLVVEVAVLITSKVQKWDSAVNGRPWAVAAHVHLIVLGAVWFFVMALLEKNFSVSSNRIAKPTYIVYLCGLGSVVALMLYKGFTQLVGGTVVRGLAEGGAAVAHTLLFVGLFMWAYIIYKAVCKDDKTVDQND